MTPEAKPKPPTAKRMDLGPCPFCRRQILRIRYVGVSDMVYDADERIGNGCVQLYPHTCDLQAADADGGGL